MDNLKGLTAAFSTFSYFKSGFWRGFEWAVLLGAPRQSAKARKLEFLHTAHFCRISPKQLKRAGLQPKSPFDSGALLFLSTYNGDGDVYFRGFSEKIATPLNFVWHPCSGWQAAAPYPLLRAFIQAERQETAMFHHAYPDTAQGIRASLRLRRGLDQLHALAFDDRVNDRTFESAFRTLAQRQWGNDTTEAPHAD